MLLSSISSTKKFFQKTVKNFKSFFSPGNYQRLPKASPHSKFSYSVAAASSSAMDMTSNTSYQDMEKLYTDFSDQCESENEKAIRRRMKKKAASSALLPSKQESEVYSGSYISLSNARHAQKKNRVEKKEEGGGGGGNNKRSITIQKGRQKESSSSFMSMCMKEHRYCMVEQKLRELEMLDMNNVEYVLDIEEVLHYYSRLTCPAYLEIVDKFFLEMYSELFGSSSMWHASPRSVNSRLKIRYQ
uniref:OVATE domain-containing protein n=1 Tax=Glycine max TaxID=3847 RepID=C6T876_SOYBN|nr:unknown [Glycine max]